MLLMRKWRILSRAASTRASDPHVQLLRLEGKGEKLESSCFDLALARELAALCNLAYSRPSERNPEARRFKQGAFPEQSWTWPDKLLRSSTTYRQLLTHPTRNLQFGGYTLVKFLDSSETGSQGFLATKDQPQVNKKRRSDSDHSSSFLQSGLQEENKGQETPQNPCQRHADRFPEKELFLAFRGTEFDHNVLDFLSNLNASLTPFEGAARSSEAIQVHEGLHAAYLSVRDQVLDAIKRAVGDSPFKMHCTGHSSGGALAALATYDLSLRYPESHFITYTFGAPHIGNEHFKDEYECAENVTHFRVVNKSDIVAHIPYHTSQYAYEEVGQLALIYGSDYGDNPSRCKLYINPPISFTFPSTVASLLENMKMLISHHGLERGYIRSLASVEADGD